MYMLNENWLFPLIFQSIPSAFGPEFLEFLTCDACLFLPCNRLVGSIGRKGRRMWSKMQTSYFSSSMCLVVGRSEIYTLIKTFKRELCWEVLSKQVHYCYPLTCSMKKICTVSCFAVVVIFCSYLKIPHYSWPLGTPWIYFSKLDWQEVERAGLVYR